MNIKHIAVSVTDTYCVVSSIEIIQLIANKNSIDIHI